MAPRGEAVVLCQDDQKTSSQRDSRAVLYEIGQRSSAGSPRTLPVPSQPAYPTSPRFNGILYGATFSPDGASILLWGGFHDAIVVPRAGGDPLRLPSLASSPSAGAFSGDGRLVAVTSIDGEIRVVPLGWSDLAADLASRVITCLSQAERRRYLGESADVAMTRWRACEIGHRGSPERGEPGR